MCGARGELCTAGPGDAGQKAVDAEIGSVTRPAGKQVLEGGAIGREQFTEVGVGRTNLDAVILLQLRTTEAAICGHENVGVGANRQGHDVLIVWIGRVRRQHHRRVDDGLVDPVLRKRLADEQRGRVSLRFGESFLS